MSGQTLDMEVNIAQFKNEATITFQCTPKFPKDSGLSVKMITWKFNTEESLKYGFATSVDIITPGDYYVDITVTDNQDTVYETYRKNFSVLALFRENNIIEETARLKIPLPNVLRDTFCNFVFKVREGFIILDKMNEAFLEDEHGNKFIKPSMLKHPVTGEWICELNYYTETFTIAKNSSYTYYESEFGRPLVNLNMRVLVKDRHPESVTFGRWLLGDSVIIQAYDFENKCITLYNTRDDDYEVKVVTNFKKNAIPPADLYEKDSGFSSNTNIPNRTGNTPPPLITPPSTPGSGSTETAKFQTKTFNLTIAANTSEIVDISSFHAASADEVLVTALVKDINPSSPTQGMWINSEGVATVAYTNTNVSIYNNYSQTLDFLVKVRG